FSILLDSHHRFGAEPRAPCVASEVRASLRAAPMASVVSVLGGGSWGTALAVHLARIGHEVRLWARSPDFVGELERAGENAVYLPGVPFPASLTPVGSLAVACDASEMLVVVCPSSAVRGLAEAVRPLLSRRPIVV